MKKHSRIILFFSTLCLASFLAACQGGENLDERFISENPQQQQSEQGENLVLKPGQSYRLGSEEIRVLSGEFKTEGSCLRGDGHLRFQDRPREEDSWNLELDLDLPSGAKTRFLWHARNDQSGALAVDIEPNGLWIEAAGERIDWSRIGQLPGLLQGERIRFSVDIHNDEHHKQFAHLIFFDLRGSVLMDSALDTDGVPGKGRGRENHIFLSGGAGLCSLRIERPRSGG